MPQLDPSSYASQIFWLLICFFAMMFIMSKFIVPKIAEIRQQRTNKIEGYLQKAEQLKQKTEEAVSKYETALNEANKQANENLQKTKDDLSKFIAEKQSALDKKLHRKIQNSEAEINAEKEAALKEIKNVSVDLTADILNKLNIKDISKADIKTIVNNEAK